MIMNKSFKLGFFWLSFGYINNIGLYISKLFNHRRNRQRRMGSVCRSFDTSLNPFDKIQDGAPWKPIYL